MTKPTTVVRWDNSDPTDTKVCEGRARLWQSLEGAGGGAGNYSSVMVLQKTLPMP